MGKKKMKSKIRGSSDTSSSSSESEQEKEKKKLRKLKKKLRREKKKTEKALKKKLKEEIKKLKKARRSSSRSVEARKDEISTDIPIELMEKSKAMAPMTKEEWEKKQSVVRRVLDEDSGRYRLIKGEGEVLEEIVSQDRHRQINREATIADGNFFQMQSIEKLKFK
ncbi:unnamed protein product [Leptosia nina]|uniref:ADP-ribosylation factor-like protein 6-interacting protein 4 n=1 Tax=Leptosia nina TaxID=320188 RepID=A0AAV1IVV4_9NEOP